MVQSVRVGLAAVVTSRRPSAEAPTVRYSSRPRVTRWGSRRSTSIEYSLEDPSSSLAVYTTVRSSSSTGNPTFDR